MMKVIRRQSKLTRYRCWIWYIERNGVIVSPHYHSKKDANKALPALERYFDA